MMKEWTTPVIDELEVAETRGGNIQGLENSNPQTSKASDIPLS